MTPKPSSSRDSSPRPAYTRPVLTRYRPPEGRIEFYQTGTGVVNAIGCTNRDLCTGGGGAAAPPPWMIPG